MSDVQRENRRTCTGLTASWCPVHGSCACPRHGDADNPVTSEVMRGEVIEGLMEDARCPLHAPSSEHPRQAVVFGSTVGVDRG